MIKLCLVFALLASTLSFRIKKNIDISELKALHGWFIVGGTYLSKGKIYTSSIVELVSNLHQFKNYTLELLIINEDKLQSEQLHHCSVIDENMKIENRLQKDKAQLSYISQTSTLLQHNASQFTFIILRDCSHTLIKQYFQKNAYIQIDLTLYNQDQLILQEQIIQSIAVFSIFGYVYLIIGIRKWTKHEGNMNKIAKFICVYIALNALGVFVEQAIRILCLFHISHYLSLQILQILLNSASGILLIYILANVSLGWTITTEQPIILTSYYSKILLFIIQAISSYLSLLYSDNLVSFVWAKDVSFIINLLIHFGYLVLIIRKIVISSHKQRILYKFLLLIAALRIICVPYASLLLQRNTYYIYKQIVASLVILVQLLINYTLAKIFIGQSSLHYRLCLSNKSFME